jgi:CspA family cold shock protein
MTSKFRDFRRPRRRGFDDDGFMPSDVPEVRSRPSFSAPRHDPPAAEGPVFGGTVKWFNAQKGFGFVAVDDGSGDAFLHIGTLQAAGRETLLPGAKLRIQVSQGMKGRQVARVLEVDDSTATAAPPRREPGRFARPDTPTAAAIEVTGTVKWFNDDKGFGFAAAEGGGKDVFIHISILDRSGLTGLAQGQRVSMRVVETPKGREATSISVIG